MLTIDRTKHLFNLSIYKTLRKKKVRVNYLYNIYMNEYTNMTISKQQIALETRMSSWCNASTLACRPSGWCFDVHREHGSRCTLYHNINHK